MEIRFQVSGFRFKAKAKAKTKAGFPIEAFGNDKQGACGNDKGGGINAENREPRTENRKSKGKRKGKSEKPAGISQSTDDEKQFYRIVRLNQHLPMQYNENQNLKYAASGCSRR